MDDLRDRRMGGGATLGSRAVLARTEGFSDGVHWCAACGQSVHWTRTTPQRVICNVYVDGSWDRVEFYHPPCYRQAGSPYGGVHDDQQKG